MSYLDSCFRRNDKRVFQGSLALCAVLRLLKYNIKSKAKGK
jgi:hypothetical protein